LDSEWAQVAESLTELADAGLISYTELAAPTLSELRRALLADTFHVLHYMGHGGFDQEHGGILLFTDRAGRGLAVTGGDLGVMLRDHGSLRLAVLNACEAGRTDPADPFAGVADTLVRRGIPAVVAMQFEVSDQAAVEFAPALYGALAAGHPVDAAVAEARKAMYTISPLEWATPVLYLRADDAHLFDIPQTSTAAFETRSRVPNTAGPSVAGQEPRADEATSVPAGVVHQSAVIADRVEKVSGIGSSGDTTWPEHFSAEPAVNQEGVKPNNGGFTHYIEKWELTRGMAARQPVEGLCGWKWVPQDTGEAASAKFPICPRCKAIYEELPDR
jgi:hypothetical protein